MATLGHCDLYPYRVNGGTYHDHFACRWHIHRKAYDKSYPKLGGP